MTELIVLLLALCGLAVRIEHRFTKLETSLNNIKEHCPKCQQL